MKLKKSFFESNLFFSLFAIAIGFVIGAIFLTIAKISPGYVYSYLGYTVLGRTGFIIWALSYSAPIILTGISVAFANKTGVFNIGAEGQFVIGEMIATLLGLYLHLPAGIHAIVCIIGAALGGFIWSLFVALLKVKRSVNEVLAYIMFNWIAFYLSNYVVNLPKNHHAIKESSRYVDSTARLLLPEAIRLKLNCPVANCGIVIAVLIAIVVWVVLYKTTIGFKYTAVGLNSEAAAYAGIDADKSVFYSMGISGAISGIAGAVHLLGMLGSLPQFSTQESFGFNGIAVSLIGCNNPLGCILSGIFYGGLKYGSKKINVIGAPSEITNIIMGCVILIISISTFISMVVKRRKSL